MSETDYYAVSKENVQRWVGAHIIPVHPPLFNLFEQLTVFQSADVDVSTQRPYDTLTEGVTITFRPITGAHHPPGEPKIDTDAAHFATVKGNAKLDTDAAHFSSVKGPAPETAPGWKEYEINDGIYMIERRQVYILSKPSLIS